jgi:cell wall-associated protease
MNKNYPSRIYLNGKEARNWMEIGASSAGENPDFVGSFSNYGKKEVDVFAPGVQVYSTQPNNQYKPLDGTSFSCPSTVGVAALLMSYYPDLTAFEVKDILRNSTRKFDGLEVQKPGGGKTQFGNLSSTGGLINAYEALKMADDLKKVKLPK